MNFPTQTGLFDLQVNGFGGVDFQRPQPLEAIRAACQSLVSCGTTRILATLITQPLAGLRERLAQFEDQRRQDSLIRSTIAGYHIEGPYLSPEPGFRGAHPAEHMLDPEWGQFEDFQAAAQGNIRLITLAPERKGAARFIQKAVSKGVRIALGHTDADERQIDDAIGAGATLCTHLGNGCPELMHRHDNVIHRLLGRDELTACLIPDGIHLPPRVLKNLFRAKPFGKVILTTDAMAAAAAGRGRYTIGPIEVEVGEDEVVRMPGARNFAGSALRLDQGVARATNWLGIPFEEAVKMASTIPARALGFE